MRISPRTPAFRHATGAAFRLRCAGLLVPEEIVQHLGHGLAGQMAVGDAVDLHDRGQRAAAEAGDLLDGEQPLGVGVLALRELQVPAEGLLDQLGPFDVAGRAVADVDDVPADRPVAELVVEGGNAGDRGRRDLRQLADTPNASPGR